MDLNRKEEGLKSREDLLKQSQENLYKERELIKKETQELLSNTSHYISKMPSLVADFNARLFDGAVSFLRKKRHPAQTSAAEIKKILKKEYKEVVASERSVRYKLELLLSLFP